MLLHANPVNVADGLRDGVRERRGAGAYIA